MRTPGWRMTPCASLLGEDDLCALGPHKGFGISVVAIEIVVDGVLELGNARERDAPDPLLRDLCEEALNQIEPRRTGRREVHMEAAMLGKPTLHGRCLMGSVVVEHEMDIEVLFTHRSIRLRNLMNSLARCRGWHSPMTSPLLASGAANRVVVPLRL